MKRVSDASEPPVVIPIIVVLIHIHVTLIVVAIEGREALYKKPSTSLPIQACFHQGSCCILFGIIMPQYFIPSIFIFFEVSTYITLFETVVANTLGVWILGSVAENLNLPHIHLLPYLF